MRMNLADGSTLKELLMISFVDRSENAFLETVIDKESQRRCFLEMLTISHKLFSMEIENEWRGRFGAIKQELAVNFSSMNGERETFRPSVLSPEQGSKAQRLQSVSRGMGSRKAGARMADRFGQKLGNYTLVQLLGRGAFADVYLAEHIYLKTQMARAAQSMGAAEQVLHLDLISAAIFAAIGARP